MRPLFLAALMGASLPAQTALMLDRGGPLYVVDLTNGNYILVSNIANNGMVAPGGLAWRDDTRELYTVDGADGEVGRVDINTGTYTKLWDTFTVGINGIAWDPITKKFYLVDQADALHSIDPATGTFATIGPITIGGLAVSLDVDGAGRLVGTDNNGPTFILDKTTAATTVRTTPGINGLQIAIDGNNEWWAVSRYGVKSLHMIDPDIALSGVTTVGPLSGIQTLEFAGPVGFELIDVPIMRAGEPCADGNGDVRHIEVTGNPAINGMLSVQVERLDPMSPAPVSIQLGFSDRIFGGQPLLPLDLGLIGATGCTRYTSIEVDFGLSAAGVPLPIAIPGDPNNIGLVVYFQAFVIDPVFPPANPTMVLTTDYARVVITS